MLQTRSYSSIHSCRRKSSQKPITQESSPLKQGRSQNLYTQATLKNPNQPFKSIFLYKTSSIPEIASDSTMSSNNRQRAISDLKPKPVETLETVEPSSKKYILKSSKSFHRKTPAKSSDQVIHDYFAGFNFPRRAQMRTEHCCLEYWLEGCRNSVNALAADDVFLITGDANGEVRRWTLPQQNYNEYFAKTYIKGSVFTSNILLHKHKKPVVSLEKLSNSKVFLSAFKDGIIKLFRTHKLQKTRKTQAGLNLVKKISNEKIFAGGSFLEFLDLNTFQPFRGSVKTSPILSSASHSVFTFLTGNEDSCVSLWDIRTPRSISCFEGHKGPVTGVTMSSGFTFLTCSEDCSLREWDLRTLSEVSFRKSDSSLKDIHIKNDFILTAGKSLTLWMENSSEKVQFHESSVKILHLANDLSFAGGYDGRVSCMSLVKKLIN
jgi:WD40 repeat protein